MKRKIIEAPLVKGPTFDFALSSEIKTASLFRPIALSRV